MPLNQEQTTQEKEQEQTHIVNHLINNTLNQSPMTTQEKVQIAEMIATAINSQNSTQEQPVTPSERPQVELGQALPLKEVSVAPIATQVVVTPTQSLEQPVQPVQQTTHTPALVPEQIQDVMNDARVEVRVTRKYPLVKALEEAFKSPAATAVINGKNQALISLDQMAEIVARLKKEGSYWPSPVITVQDQGGNRMYMNTSYKREDGKKWAAGDVVTFKK